MNYTKEMQEANIPPELGMQFICSDNTESSRIKDFKGFEVEVIGVCYCGEQVVITFKHSMRGIGCGVFSPFWVKPIDARTDTEKAVDDLRQINRAHIISDIKAGKITGCKWVGND